MKIQVFATSDHAKTRLIIAQMNPTGAHVIMVVSAKARLNNITNNTAALITTFIVLQCNFHQNSN